MTNLTLTIDETQLRKARIVALERGTSVNALVREFIEKTLVQDAPELTRAELFMQIIEQGKFAFTGPRMTREAMYESEPRYQHPRRSTTGAPAPESSPSNRS